jgi:hypothetical protein
MRGVWLLQDADPATARVIHVEGAEASGGAAASRDTSASRLPLHARVAELDDEDAEVGSARESTYPSSQPDSVEEPASEAEEAEEQGRRRVHVHRPTAGRGEGGGAPRRVKVAGGERRPGGGEPLEEAVPRGNAMKRHPHSQRRE